MKKLSSILTNKKTYVLLLVLFISIFWLFNLFKANADITFLPDNLFVEHYLKDIESSEKNIFISIFFFKIDDQKGAANEIKSALIRAKNRGVDIYIVMEQAEKDISTDVNKFTGGELEKHGISVRYDSPFNKLHSKMTVIDENIVYIGSHNYTNSALSRNNETSVRIISKKIAKEAINYIKSIKTFELLK
ncbi:MAG: phospholipase D-like domain-containing protein [Calditerrivibrio sp.]|nr:phospholipase D-like domain-containing protein [Calditerrivibrio sp.]